MFRKPAFAVLFLLAAALGDATTRPSPISVEKIVRTQPDLRLFVVRVDLTDPRLRIVVSPGGPDPDGAGPWETTLMPTSAIAARDKLDLAVNTVFFARQKTDPTEKPGPGEKLYLPDAPARSVQPVVADGKRLSPADAGVSLMFGPDNRGRIGSLQRAGANVINAVSGDRALIVDGQLVPTNDAARHPRTAAGLADDGKTLFLLVVDGRRPGWSIGLTLTELAQEMAALGCTQAVNLDGGGSTTLVRRTGDTYPVVNLPSDGSALPIPLSIERPVPYVLGFRLTQ